MSTDVILARIAPAPRSAVAYVRALPGDPPLEVDVQRMAVSAACNGEDLVQMTAFEEPAENAGIAFLEMVEALRDHAGDTVVMAATAAVFGERVRDRARRILQLAALGIPLRMADGRRPGDALVAAWEERGPEERRRERARDGMRRRALRGEVLGRSAYGYNVDQRQLTPNAAEAEIVRRIFDWYLDDEEGVRRIARLLNQEGALTRSGRPWTAGAVRNVLRNPVYTGLYRRLDVAVPRAHPSIISGERFAEAQRRMARRRTAPSTQERREYLLAGIARCGHCGAPMIGARRPMEGDTVGENVYYRCSAATNEGRCAYHTRRADALEAAVREELTHATPTHPVAVRAPSPITHDARLVALDRTLERMLERRATGQWTDAELVRRSAPVVLEHLDIEVAAAAEREDAIEPHEARSHLVEDWDALTFEHRRALLRRAVAEVVVTDEAVRVTRRR